MEISAALWVITSRKGLLLPGILSAVSPQRSPATQRQVDRYNSLLQLIINKLIINKLISVAD